MVTKRKIKIILIIVLSFLVAAVSGLLAYTLLSMKQEQTATMTIRFTGRDIDRGYVTDGTKTEVVVQEIKSTEVLSEAAKELGVLSPDELSKGIEIAEVIPAIEVERKESAMKNGNEYEYFPYEYEVSYTTDNMDLDAKQVLSAIMQSFYKNYEQNHLSMLAIPANGGQLVNDGYDFIENADILYNAIENMEWFLGEMETMYPAYKSFSTGYSYGELKLSFKTLKDWNLAELYSEIIRGQATKAPDELRVKLTQRTDINTLLTENEHTDLAQTEELLQTYSEKNKVKASNHQFEADIDNSIDENHTNVLDLVYENEVRPKTAYDDIIQKYINESDNVSFMQDDSDYYAYLLEAFDGATVASQEKQYNITAKTNMICDELNELYAVAAKTNEEHVKVLGIEAVRTIGTPFIEKKFRVKLYTVVFAAGMFVMTFMGLAWLSIVAGHIKNRMLQGMAAEAAPESGELTDEADTQHPIKNEEPKQPKEPAVKETVKQEVPETQEAKAGKFHLKGKKSAEETTKKRIIRECIPAQEKDPRIRRGHRKRD